MDVELVGPMIPDRDIRDCFSFRRLNPGIDRLFSERVNPIAVSLLESADDIVLRTTFKVFVAQLEAPLYFNLLHASVFGLAFDVVRGNKDALVSIVLSEMVIAHLSLALPPICHLDNFLSFAF